MSPLAFITDPAEVDFAWCGMSFTIILPSISWTINSQTTGWLLLSKGCDARGIIRLLQDKQIEREKVYPHWH